MFWVCVCEQEREREIECMHVSVHVCVMQKKLHYRPFSSLTKQVLQSYCQVHKGIQASFFFFSFSFFFRSETSRNRMTVVKMVQDDK